MNKSNIIKSIKILVGACLMSFAFVCFLLPNNLVTGGVSGVSVLLNYLFGWNASILTLAINVPLLVLCYLFLGKSVFFRTVIAGLLFPATMWLMSSLPAITSDALLASIFGGVITGMGLGLVFSTNSSSAGTGILAQLANKYFGIPIGRALMIVDSVIVISGLLIFNAETMLYSILSLYISIKVSDYFMLGGTHSVAIHIISDKEKEIQQAIYQKLDRGITRIAINSNFNPALEHILLCVVPTKQFVQCKQLILSIDQNAFILVYETSEVAGRGFTSSKEYEQI